MTDHTPLSQVKNIGPVTSKWLTSIGIRTVADLKRIGAVEAYRQVRLRQPRATLNLLWALAAAIQGIAPNDLTLVAKNELRHGLVRPRKG